MSNVIFCQGLCLQCQYCTVSHGEFPPPGRIRATCRPQALITLAAMNRRGFLRTATVAAAFAGPYRRLASALANKVKISGVKCMIVRGTWDWNLIKIETD